MARPSRGYSNPTGSGATFVEVLVASLLLVVGLAGLVSLWYFSNGVTVKTEDWGFGYQLGRRRTETIKQLGFEKAAEGSSTTYYTSSLAVAPNQSSARYTVNSTVTSSALGGGLPTQSALRTVAVTVIFTPTQTVLYSSSTYLVRGGI